MPVHTESRWGELKQATVLFADVVGSTEHIAGLDPEQTMAQMRPAVLRMCASVERFGGTVLRTMGDGVMAIFGVPKALEGHARLACEAALHMQNAFAEDAYGLTIRVGLHSGAVASDPQDAEGAKGGGAHGMTIHIASRVVALAEPGQVTVTATSRALIADAYKVVGLGPRRLKGIADPVEVYVLYERPRGALDMTYAPMVPTPFCGRHHEMARLLKALDETVHGRAQVVGVSAQPGGGKSRMCQEFLRIARLRGTPVFETRVQLYGHATPLQPIFDVLRKVFFAFEQGDSADKARTQISQRIALLPDARAMDAAMMCDFLGLAVDGEGLRALSARARHARLLELTGALMRSEPQKERVIYLEDLHWVDDASEEFVRAMVEATKHTRTLLLLNYRPNYLPSWADFSHVRTLALPELSPQDISGMVRALLGDYKDHDRVLDLVVSRSAGNPFFAEELVRTIKSAGYLAEGELTPQRIQAIARALPPTVQAVVGARLDRLGEPEKTLLQMCAIVGKEISVDVLARVASPLADMLEIGLMGLFRAELIVPLTEAGGRHFAFRHPLIQEIAYNSQLKVRRDALHGAVATAMQAFYTDRLDEYAGLIAYHYEAAGRLVEAAVFGARAARWVGSTDSSQAIKRWRNVRRLLLDQPESAATHALRALAGGRIVYLGWREGLLREEVEQLTQESLALASHADPRLVQLLLFAQGRMRQSVGGPADDYVASVRSALQLQSATPNVGREATLQLALGQAYAWAGLMREGLIANDFALKNLHHIDAFDREFIGFSVEQWVLSIRARLLNRMGRFEEAEQCLAQMPADVGTSEDPVMRQIAHHVYVDLAWCKGDAALAQRHAGQVMAIAESHSNPYTKVFGKVCVGTACLTAGDHHSAKTIFEDALLLIRQNGVAVDFETEVLAGLAESARHVVPFAQARDIALEALQLARTRNNRVTEARAQIALVAMLIDAGEALSATEVQERRAEAIRLIHVSGAICLNVGLERAVHSAQVSLS